MVNLKVNFCGVESPNPFWLASSPVSNSAEMVSRAFDAGWGGAIWKTLGLDGPEGPIVNVTPRLAGLDFEEKKLLGLENIELITDRPLKENLKEISEIKKKYPKNPVFVSIMAGPVREDWQKLTRIVEEAGADGIELNFSCPHGMPEKGMGMAIGQIPDVCQTITTWVKEVAKTPVMAKMTPNITDILVPARASKKGGADGISAINTIQSFLGVNLDTLEPLPTVDGKSMFGGYSGPAVKPIALRFVAQLSSDKGLALPISGIGGIATWKDAAEFILAGATTIQVCTAIMRNGYRIVEDMSDGLSNFMEEKGFASVSEMVGKILPKLGTHESLNKKKRMVCSINRDICVKDDLCYIACQDGGHQAIKLDDKRLPAVDEEKCAGCGLCVLVCPVYDCVTMKEKTK
ncbi:MAG: NAD-dependent dihydropyrimidine dehydrogenase subunit PreA [Elusimicrobiota bacterium]